MSDAVAPVDPNAEAAPSAEGPAFPVVVRALVTALTAWVFAAGWQAMDKPAVQQASFEAKALVAAGLAVLVIVTLWVWRSRTEVNAEFIRQTWIWPKRVAWADVSHAKMIYVPYLAWLVAPRLVVRSGAGMVTVFHAADHELLTTFTHYALSPGLRQSAR